jgi:hypothetical protein
MSAMRLSVSTHIHAPRDRVFALYANYANWPTIFPTIKGVRLVRDEGDGKLLEIDHVEGRVPNVLRLRPPDTIEVDEVKRRYTATFRNTFETVPDGTRYTLAGDIHRQMTTLVLEPIKHVAESHTADSR